MHLKYKDAEVQLSRLKKLQGKDLLKKENLLSGYFQIEMYHWVAFDNRTGNLWVAKWQCPFGCTYWLDKDPG